MKLNYKNTLLIGFAFLSISAFWQMYDNLVPLILTKTFSMNETVSGIIMAADNILALFLLPLFGGISDRSNAKMGKRKPFILYGTIFAVILMTLLPILDNSYFAVPASWKLFSFVGILGLLLISMGIYRSPAVALMPDVTPKPLRSEGNAVINLMGAVGGILYLIANTILYSKSRTEGLEHINYQPIFAIVSGIMLLALLILIFFVNEPKLRAEQAEYEKSHPEEDLATEVKNDKKKMPKAVKKSLIFLLLSVAFWYIGYNAITTWFTVYATTMWDMAPGGASLCLTIAMGGAIITFISVSLEDKRKILSLVDLGLLAISIVVYLVDVPSLIRTLVIGLFGLILLIIINPVGYLTRKVGRSITIKVGVALLAVCFFAAFVYTLLFGSFHWGLYILFVLVGIAWAAINVNSLPMVVEMCSGAEVGKFTGFYYTFSMAAQTVTPVVAGYLLSNVSYKALFPYAAIFVALSFITMCFVKHGDSKPMAKASILENFDIED